MRLEPGESTLIEAIFTPGSIGQQKKHINVQWDGSKILKLEFTAESYG